MSKKKKKVTKPREYSRRQLSSHRRQQRRQRLFFFGGIAIIVAVVGIILGGWIIGEYIPLHKTVLEVFDKQFDTAFYVDTMVILAKLQNASNLSDITGPAANQILGDELIIQEAEKLGITVTEEEARRYWVNTGIEINDAAIHIAKSLLLRNKLTSDYFSTLVPTTDNQVRVRAMLVESDTVAQLLRERVLNGENFSLLAEEYAQNYYSKENYGEFGWHPLEILKELIASDIPYNYIIGEGVKPGDVSPPLSDNASYKQIGYWLVRVKERLTEDSANVSAILVSSEEEALGLRARLEAGEPLADIADNYSQFTMSQQQHGEIGLIYSSENVTYPNALIVAIFDPSLEVGIWSQPVREDTLWTRGGSWLVQIVDKDENRELSTDDRNSLIDKRFSEWADEIWAEYSPMFINSLNEDPGLQQWAVERALREF